MLLVGFEPTTFLSRKQTCDKLSTFSAMPIFKNNAKAKLVSHMADQRSF